VRAQTTPFEVIAIDDGSSDQTFKVLKVIQQEHPAHLRLARHITNKGNGAALRTGIRLARGDIVLTMDADGQHSPDDIPTLLSEIPPYDLVIGARTESYEGSWYRGVANGIYNRFASWLTRAEIKDLTSGFRAMRREVALHFLPLFPAGFSAPTTTTMAFLKAGYNVTFLPIHVAQRSSGSSKIRLWSDGTTFFRLIFRMIMLYDPLRIFFPAGVTLITFGLFAWVAGLINAGRLVFPNSAIFLMSAALLTWLLGLISDQIASTRIKYYGDEHIVMIEADEEGIHQGHAEVTRE
jgi:glycosyltransferase involved in cell wall biosynthesis